MWSPNINIFRDPRWGRGHETYGEDPYLTTRLGVRFIDGLQGEGKYLKVAACAKHFAVHSGPEAIRHEFDAKADAKDLSHLLGGICPLNAFPCRRITHHMFSFHCAAHLWITVPPSVLSD